MPLSRWNITGKPSASLTVTMRAPFATALAALSLVPAFAHADCIDCTLPVIANPGWANGELANGNYYSPAKTGNWLLANSVSGTGELELRNNGQLNYVYNKCPVGHSGYCRTYISQLITIQEGVDYQFKISYAMSNIRAQSNTLEMYVETFPDRARLFDQYIFSGNAAQWTDYTPPIFTAPSSGDVLLTLTWRNDPNDGIVMIKNVEFPPVVCADATSPLRCENQPEPEPTPEPTPSPTSTITSSTETSTAPTTTAPTIRSRRPCSGSTTPIVSTMTVL